MLFSCLNGSERIQTRRFLLAGVGLAPAGAGACPGAGGCGRLLYTVATVWKVILAIRLRGCIAKNIYLFQFPQRTFPRHPDF